jgi:transposase
MWWVDAKGSFGRGTHRSRDRGVDGTILEANTALRSIVRKDSRESYTEFLTEVTKASGMETRTRAELAKIGRKRPKKGSNATAKIMKTKDGSTHLAQEGRICHGHG